AFAAALQANGVGEGTHVAIMGPTTRDLIVTIQAVWLAGGVLVMLPLPMRMGSVDGFIAQTRDRMRFAKAEVVVLDPQLAAFLEPQADDPTFVRFDDLRPETTGLSAADWKRPTPDPDGLAVLQFTSGSTSEPKGVMLTHRQICANMDACAERARFSLDDVVVSWLPLYHDMGLIGLFTIPMTVGVELVQAAPQDFLAKPTRWMQWLHDYRATITAGPNFAYALAARALKRAEGLDLSCVRFLLSGAEPIDGPTYRQFLDAGAPFGLNPNAAFPAFGMAEVCIGGTFPEPFTGLRTDVVEAEALESEGRAVPATLGGEVATRELALLGKPLRDMKMRIVDVETGELLGDRRVGELHLAGTSVTSGYYERPDATAELFDGEWLRTGDLAYSVDGELVICGRIKDVMIVGGRNIYPQDVEVVAGNVEGVRTGNVIAFGIDDSRSSQHIVVVAEARTDDANGLAKAVTRAVSNEIGIPPREVVFVKPGTIAKTSSGKLQRALCKAEYGNGELQLID
ncbi:MAG: fatty acyl-AMP ligase, partial [Actinobacteria bacterium]|nr:fatty acyl-AMP ligase [Actinomycetota bacterium]